MASTARDDPTTRDVLRSPSRAGRPGLWRRFARNPFAAAAVVYLVAIVLAAVFAPLLTRYAPDRIIIGQELQPPSAAHWVGTDQSARDEFSRLLYGARISLAIGIIAMLLSVTFGTAVGAVSGFFGGAADAIGMRLTDAMLAIPVFFLLLAVLASVGSSVPTIILAIGLSSWMATARVVRSEVLRTANLDFVTAARVLGATRLRLLVRHVLPQAFPSMLVASTLGVGQAILIESALSYLGVGVQPPTASWGNMLSNAQSYVFAAPLLALWPGLFILLTVLSFNFIGDASRDALSPYQT
ncbi:MAG TPA: ABC transporter permease [Thermomicrobiaceae bacterium]|nr:ABC transporter permease [Thermomicrobiaceae bacterium]